MYFTQSALLLAIVIGMAHCLPTASPAEKVHRSTIIMFEHDEALHNNRMGFINGGVKDVLGHADASHFTIGSTHVMLIQNASDSELKNLKASAESLQATVFDNLRYRINLPTEPEIVPIGDIPTTVKTISTKDATSCATRTLTTAYSHQLDLLDLHDGDGTYCSPVASATKMNVFTLDTGIDKTHTEFAGLEINTYDANDGSTGTQWTPLVDQVGHGTHVAGIIASKSYGVTPNVAIFAVKVLDDEGSGTTSTIIGGFTILENWLKANPTKKATINMSVGGPRDTPLERALAALATTYGDRVVFAVAAGNENSNACTTNLPSVTQVIAVGSVSSSLSQSSFSNYGSCVDIYSVGEKIISTYLDNQYALMSGTSMATPVVVGVISQYWLQNPSLTGVAIRNLIMNQVESDVDAKGMLSRLSTGSPNKFIRYTCPGACSGSTPPTTTTSSTTTTTAATTRGATTLSTTTTTPTPTRAATTTPSPTPSRSATTLSTTTTTPTPTRGATTTSTTTTTTTTTTRISSNPCSPNPCLNNGRCYVSRNSFFCSCPRNYYGNRCQSSCLFRWC